MILDDENILMDNCKSIVSDPLNALKSLLIERFYTTKSDETYMSFDIKDELYIQNILSLIFIDNKYNWYVDYNCGIIYLTYRPYIYTLSDYILYINFLNYKKFNEIQPYIKFNDYFTQKDILDHIKKELITKLNLKEKGVNLYVVR